MAGSKNLSICIGSSLAGESQRPAEGFARCSDTLTPELGMNPFQSAWLSRVEMVQKILVLHDFSRCAAWALEAAALLAEG